LGDYTQIPRGRVFQKKDGSFQLMCGSWITQEIVDLVEDEFDLQNQIVEVIKDEHGSSGLDGVNNGD
jgi:hypothetical protein